MPSAAAPAAVQMRAGPSPSRRMTARREERADERADPAGRHDDAEQERVEMQVVDQVDRVQDPVERPGDMGDDRPQRRSGTAPDGGGRAGGPSTISAPDRGRGRPWSGAAGSGVRMRSSEIAETTNDTASTRIANGALTSWTRRAGEARAADLGDRRARRELAVALDDAIDADE